MFLVKTRSLPRDNECLILNCFMRKFYANETMLSDKLVIRFSQMTFPVETVPR